MSVVQGASSSANGFARACEAQHRGEDEARVLGTSTACAATKSDSSYRSTASTASNSDISDRSTASTAKTKLSVGRRRQRSIINPHKGFGGF